MNEIDFVVCLGLASIAAGSLFLGWYWITLFAVLFFFLVVANICLFNMQLPQPRYYVELEFEPDDTPESQDAE